MRQPTRRIYLASKSPRRRELLRQIGVEFELLLLRTQGPRGPDVNEDIKDGESPYEYVSRIAREKAAYGWQSIMTRSLPARPVLGADTTVVLDDRILGKPGSEQEAREMLRALSGRTHQVLTGVAVRLQDRVWETVHVSEVTFGDLPESAINAYCSTVEPYDKAGGYGIQGRAAIFIKHISGSYSGIMGLPLFETSELLQQAGICIP
jgi:septum formation protein